MKTNLFTSSLIIIVLILLSGCQPGVAATGPDTAVAIPFTSPATPTCGQPTPDIAPRCAEMEQQILASTVRLEMYLWQEGTNGRAREFIDDGISHATVKEGRYLVTHNHFHIPLDKQEQGEIIRLSVYRANGEIILEDVPLTAFTVMMEDTETMLLDFQSYVGQGLFDMIGMPSAEFKTWDSLSLQPGMEVAQVDWNGLTAQVEWVEIETIITVDSTPQLVLSNDIIPGASGGGVFWQGYHIANNWKRMTDRDAESGQILRQYSVAALDSLPIVAATMTEVALPALH